MPYALRQARRPVDGMRGIAAHDGAGRFGLLNTLATITGRKAGFRSLADAWATTPHGAHADHARRTGRVPAGSHPCTHSEGRERAKARGVKMGRPCKLTPHQQREALRRRDRGNETLADIARTYNVSAATISRLAAEHG